MRMGKLGVGVGWDKEGGNKEVRNIHEEEGRRRRKGAGEIKHRRRLGSLRE